MKQLANIFKKISTYLLVLGVMILPVDIFAQTQTLTEVLNEARSQGIENELLQELQNRAQSRAITDEELVQIIEPAVDLAKENLPSEMVLQKALEGLSKGVSSSRMIPVLQNMQSATRQAGPVVNPWIEKPNVQEMIRSRSQGLSEAKFRNELIKAVSKGVMKGVSAETFSSLLDETETEGVLSETGPASMVAAVGVISDLDDAGGQSAASKSMIVRSLKAGFDASELQKLPAAIKMAQQRGQLPAANVIEGISHQLNAGVPAQQILQNLFDGNIGGGPPGGTPPGLEKRQKRGNGRGNNRGGQ
jgi:predicted lipid carrier protein YhbT